MATALAYLQPGAMETTFYHDEIGRSDHKQGEIVKKLKTGMNTSRPMTLDFLGAKKKDQKAFTPLLSSPDLNMLKLASPDLERLIIQQNGHVTTTPTPSGVLSKCPTEEQEAYARGFVDALNELHQQQGPQAGAPASPMTLIRSSIINAQAMASTASSQANNENSLPATFLPTSSATLPLTTTTSLPGGVIQFTSQQNAEPMRTESPLYTMSMQGGSPSSVIKEELPQTVPCLGIPMSPIDMDSQERVKLERKRARNRVAARKCRTRKLERISRLEDRVNDLKGQNNDLQSTANSLRDQVCQLKKQIMTHVSSGCQIMTTSQSNLL